jgi:calcium-dependent protein kinase
VAEGGELMERIVAARSFSEADASALFRQMCAAVGHCHERLVVVRDLKPENFLFATRARDSPLKLTDLGLGCAVSSPDEVITDACGSAYYIAPGACVAGGGRVGGDRDSRLESVAGQ